MAAILRRRLDQLRRRRQPESENPMSTKLFGQFQYPIVPLSVSSDFKQRVVQQMIARRIRMEDSGG
jgi:hypothetical protein